ncbi:4a-hydroxytetrahydrobiopterin dehydratase, partial [Streptomyces sp. NPDC006334]
DLTLGYDSVTLAVNTHSAGGTLTELDFELARSNWKACSLAACCTCGTGS